MKNKINETLLIAQEECAEVTQAISKIFRFGFDAEYPKDGKNNRERLEEEVGDLLCMIQLMSEFGIISESGMYKAALDKRAKLEKWSNIFKEEDEKSPSPRCATYPACIIKTSEGGLTIVKRPE